MYHVGLLMYKFYNRMLPIVFDEMFTSNSDLYSYHTRQHDLLHVPLYRTQLGLNSFNYQAVTIWNFIFLNMGVDFKIGAFKRQLKRFLQT